MPFLVTLRLGRRLDRAYGWFVDIFTLGPSHFLVKTTLFRPHMNGAQQEGVESLAAPAQDVNNSQVRSSFEIMGRVTLNHPADQLPLARGVGPNLSRPPSSMPDFGFVGQNDAPPQAVAYNQLGLRLNGAPTCLLANDGLMNVVAGIAFGPRGLWHDPSRLCLRGYSGPPPHVHKSARGG